MPDLHERLTAAVNERLEVARAAVPGPWGYNPGKQWHDGEDFVTLTNGQEFVSYGGPSPFTGCVCITGPADHPQSMADARFIAANDPATVIRYSERDLRVLARHHPDAGETLLGVPAALCAGHPIWTRYPCDEIRDLATPYGVEP